MPKASLRRKLRLENQRKRILQKKVSQNRRRPPKNLNLRSQILNKRRHLKMIKRRKKPLKNLWIKMENLKPFPKLSLLQPHQSLSNLIIRMMILKILLQIPALA